jgi:hypothetical protein
LIAPPKRVLSPGSEFWLGDTFYQITNSSERREDITWFYKSRIYRKPDKIGMYRSCFRLDRIHDASSELKKQFRMAVYNLETAKLYYITAVDNGKHKRIGKKITQMGLNQNGVQSVLSITDEKIAARFVQVIRDHVMGLIPDAYLPDPPVRKQRVRRAGAIQIDEKIMDIVNDSQYRGQVLYAMLLQHKVGCRLEWLSDDKFIHNIAQFASTHDLSTRLQGGRHAENEIEREEEEKRTTMLKRKTMYTVFPKLRKRPGAKTVTRALFGPWHKNIYHSIMTWDDGEKDFFQDAVGFLLDLSYTMSQGWLSNDTYHLISQLVKRRDSHARRQLYQISSIISTLRGNMWDHNPEPTPELLRQVAFYTRTSKKLLDLVESGDGAVNEVVNWTTFRDMMNMAQELGIRLRINKFTCAADVQRLHDRFAAFQQRDLEAHNKYDGFEFLKFESPEKEYEGFRFIQLLTPAELVYEGKTMHHCVGGYSNHCLEGRSIIFSMYKERSWVTIELDGGDQEYKIKQKYTIKDFTIRNSSMLDVIEKWHQDLLNMHRGDKELYAQRALAYYEYQKNAQKLKKYEDMTDDDMGDEERKWLAQALENTKAALESSALKMNMEVSDATQNEQVYATA